ncbi:MAG TPA: hypothetical protein VN853_05985 [Polyangia bacterium]|jgi:hypothetical protein|nr:hypothetical protein [Polyangia bacterium]
MDRREFVNLTVGSVIAMGGSLFLVSSCGSSGSSPSNEPPAAAPVQSGTQITYTTSNDSAHFHTFAVDDSAFASPPAGGVSGSTSVDSAHSHPVAISMADLQNVENGQTVLVATGSTEGHAHVLTLVLIS